MSPKVVLVTGANQGLGFEIVHVTALRDPSAIYILCSRNVKKGEEALQKLRELGVKAKIEVLELDVVNDDHIIAAVKLVEEKYGKLDVLVNNAGIIIQPPFNNTGITLDPPVNESLTSYRKMFQIHCETNLTSVAVVTEAFKPLLYKSTDPKVVSVSSGLGSITNTLTKKMGRAPSYGASKIGMNGLTAHLQTQESDRIQAETEKGEKGNPKIRFYVVAPGALKTAFSGYYPGLKDPKDGAEVITQLVVDEKGTYEGGSYWEFVEGEMKKVPW